MSFNIKQIRNNLYSDYTSYLDTIVRQTEDINDLFGNGYLQITDQNIPITKILINDFNFNAQQNYFLRFSYGFNYKQEYANETDKQVVTFKVVLKHSDQNDINQQIAGGYATSIEKDKKYQSDFFISPNSDYDKIMLTLSDTANVDLNKISNVDSNGNRYFPLKRFSLYRIKNLLGTGQIAKRIRVEGDPGLRMCINREQIIIPPSGLFEITRSNYPVTFFGFMIGSEAFSSSSFVVNYQY